MTENEWLDCKEPLELIQSVCGKGTTLTRTVKNLVTKEQYRKLWLFSTGRCRCCWEELSPFHRTVIASVEKSIETDINNVDHGGYYGARRPLFTLPISKDSNIEFAQLCQTQVKLQVELLKCLFNPYRKTTILSQWRTHTVIDLAKSIYNNLDFGAMGILGDALEESGCDSPDVLNHCHGKQRCSSCLGWTGNCSIVSLNTVTNISTQVEFACATCNNVGWTETTNLHYRGCWVLDAILWGTHGK